MNKDKFVSEIQKVISSSILLNENTILNDIPEWDSLSQMAIVSFFEENLKKEISLGDLEKLKTINDLFELSNK